MRHVTDGELHAFLDGALDLLPENRGEDVRDHISSCPVCSERLQDEELVRSQAEEILGDPELGVVALPTFEELRERAEAPGSDPIAPTKESDLGIHYRGPLRGLPTAWAATIVLALGVGWMGGQIWRTGPLGGRLEGTASSPETMEESDAQLADLEVESPQTGEPQTSRADLNAIPASSEAEERVGDLPPSAAPPEGAAERQRRNATPESEAAPRISDPIPLESMSGVGEVGEIIDSVGVGDAVLALEELVVTATREHPFVVPTEGAEGLGLNPDSLENSFAVRGLKVVSIEWEERVAGEKALLIRQLLSPGDTLELRYLGMLLGTDPDPRGLGVGGIPLEEASGGRVYANVLEASLPPGWHQVVMERGRGLLVARGPISEVNLKALLKTLH